VKIIARIKTKAAIFAFNQLLHAIGIKMNISLKHNMAVQLIALLVQMGNLLSDYVPEEYRPIVAGAVALIQVIYAKLGQSSNPDGKPVALAYNPVTKKSV